MYVQKYAHQSEQFCVTLRKSILEPSGPALTVAGNTAVLTENTSMKEAFMKRKSSSVQFVDMGLTISHRLTYTHLYTTLLQKSIVLLAVKVLPRIDQ